MSIIAHFTTESEPPEGGLAVLTRHIRRLICVDRTWSEARVDEMGQVIMTSHLETQWISIKTASMAGSDIMTVTYTCTNNLRLSFVHNTLVHAEYGNVLKRQATTITSSQPVFVTPSGGRLTTSRASGN